MTISPIDTEKSLEGLAKLLGLRIKRGWKTRIAEWLGVELRVLSKWIERKNIPRKVRDDIVKRGYPEERWLIPESPPEAQLEIGREGAESSREQVVAFQASTTHADIIQRFRDPETAQRINAKLLELETSWPDGLARVESYLDGLLAGAERIKKKFPK